MAIKYAFDLYPRTDPVNGARILRFSKLQDAEYRGEANGTGSGRIVIRGTETDAASIDPRGMDYIRVVRIDTAVVDGATLSGFSEKVVGGFFLENGDYEALTERSTKKLTFGGSGALSYLQRAQMWSHSYFPGGDDPRDGIWQDTPVDPTHTLGFILWRWMLNAQAFQSGPYNHEHADGIDYTDTHDDDRLATAIPDMTMTFDGDLDSDGIAWTIPFGALSLAVGASMLQAARLFMESGLYLEMDPDTFELNAWEAAGHGRNRTGVAWGANVIRFQAPSAATVATGNIKSDAKRGLGALVKRSVILAGSGNIYGLSSTGGSDIPWEGFYPSTNDDTDALESVAAIQLGARADAGDTVRLRIKLGNAPTTGEYLPFEHILLDDRVTLHTGTGQWDWDETEQKVAAISLKLRTGSDWDAWVDLGSQYSSMTERAFANQPVGAHTHAPNPRLCANKNCADLTDADLDALTTPNGNAENTSGTEWSGGAYQAGLPHGGSNAYGLLSDTSIDLAYSFPAGQVFAAGIRYVLEFWNRLEFLHTGSSTPFAFGLIGVDDETAFKIIEAGDGEWEKWRVCWTPSSDRTDVQLVWVGGQVSAGYAQMDDVQLYSAGLTIGTSSFAARCDHLHRHNALPGRSEPLTHPATSITVAGQPEDDVQEWIDAHSPGGSSALDWFIVTDPTYGAIGDGVADDTTAIQAAIDAAEVAGGVVYFPIGQYLISSALSIQPASASQAILLRGAMMTGDPASHTFGSVIRQATANTNGLAFGTNCYHAFIDNLKVVGPTGNSSGYGISGNRNIHCTNVWVQGFHRGYGLLGTSGVQSYYSKNVNLTAYDADDTGIYLLAGVNNVQFFGCRANGNGNDGLFAGGVNGLSWIGGSIENNGRYGALIDSAGTDTSGTLQESHAITIEGTYFEANVTADIRLGNNSASTVKQVRIAGCRFEAASGDHISGNYVDGVVIENNYFELGLDEIVFTANSINVTLIGKQFGAGSSTLPATTIRLDPSQTLTPVATGTALAAGSGPDVAYKDHVHTNAVIGAVTVSGAAAAGQVPTATSSSAATWQTPTSGGSRGAVLLESGHAVPFTFDEILQESDGSDFLWASE